MKSKQIQEFKETEIGKIPEDWEFSKIENILSQEKGSIKIGPFGSQIKKEFFIQNGIKVYGQENIFKQDFTIGSRYITKDRFEILSSCELKPNDLIISMMGTIGFIAIVPKSIEKGIMDSHLLRIRIDENRCYNKFLLYALRSPLIQNQIESFSVGTIMPGLNSKIIKQLFIPIPKLHEQEKIANTLSNLDTKIQNLQKQNKILEQIMHIIFKSLFVDFDGVTEFENSELGKIPKGWKIIPFKEMASCIKGFSYKGVEKFNEPRGFEFVTLNSIKEGGGFQKKFTWIESNRLKERHYLKEMDLIIANTEQTKDARLLATPAIIQFSINYKKQVAVYSHHISKIEPKIQNSKFYIYSFFLYYQQNIANAYHTGTGVWGFDHSSFENNHLILQPISEILEKFEKTMFNFHVKIIKNEKSISLLTLTRDLLLPKLISGEIRV